MRTIRIYRLPIQGKVLSNAPLTGDENQPLCVIPIVELPGYNPEYCFNYVCNEYNVDEEWCEVEIEATAEFHNWLTSILPQLNTIKEQKGWKLDKLELEKVRLVRKSTQ